MAAKRMHILPLSMMAIVFACLLLTGASRLIAHTQESPAPPAAVQVQAVLVSAPAPGPQTDEQAEPQLSVLRRTETAIVAVRLGLDSVVALRSDANGNVLGHRSYLHTVYRAFALGDGFA